MWTITGKPTSGAWLDPRPMRVLYEFDGPRMFVCSDRQGTPYLAYQCGEDESAMRFLIVPSGDALEHALARGEIDVRSALMRGSAWLFDLDYQWAVLHTWQVDTADLPEDCIPKAGVMLWPHLAPLPTPANGAVGSPAPTPTAP